MELRSDALGPTATESLTLHLSGAAAEENQARPLVLVHSTHGHLLTSRNAEPTLARNIHSCSTIVDDILCGD